MVMLNLLPRIVGDKISSRGIIPGISLKIELADDVGVER